MVKQKKIGFFLLQYKDKIMMKMQEDIRAVQLDLARQMETVSFIRTFVDVMAACHFNVLFLYLEWRVRTECVDLGKDEGYSSEELREIIDYAAAWGISVIPGIACFGHSEQILAKSEFAGLAELREGVIGRFGGHFAMDLCPSLEETRILLKRYIAEVAEIFSDSLWIHVGGDEVHDLGLCSLCREKAQNYDGEQKLYLEHLKFVHDIVTSLGRRMMMWDDMFELYPDILEKMPRDVIMVCWQYQDSVKEYLGHFNNLRFENRFSLYDRLGFDYMAGAVDHPWNNSRTTLAYGEQFHPIGYLLTSWEKQTCLLYHFMPNMAAAGFLWQQPEAGENQAWKETAGLLFGMDDPILVQSLRQYGNLPGDFPRGCAAALTCFDFFGPDFRSLDAFRGLFSVMEKFAEKCASESGRIIFQDILSDLRMKILGYRCSQACWNRFHGMKSEDSDCLQQEILREEEGYSQLISRYRRAGDQKAFQLLMQNWRQKLQAVEDGIRNRGCLRVLFALPDGYGAQNFRFILDGVSLQNGCFKKTGAVFFEKMIFFDPDLPVRNLLVESWGYGGQGIAYVSAVRADQCYIPQRIAAAEGVVEHSENLLKPDVSYAFFGTTDIFAAYSCRQVADTVHSLQLELGKAPVCKKV